MDEPDPVTHRHRPGGAGAARARAGPVRVGRGRPSPEGPSGGRAARQQPRRTWTRAARRGVRLEPVVHPAPAHAAPGLQLGDRDPLGPDRYLQWIEHALTGQLLTSRRGTKPNFTPVRACQR